MVGIDVPSGAPFPVWVYVKFLANWLLSAPWSMDYSKCIYQLWCKYWKVVSPVTHQPYSEWRITSGRNKTAKKKHNAHLNLVHITWLAYSMTCITDFLLFHHMLRNSTFCFVCPSIGWSVDGLVGWSVSLLFRRFWAFLADCFCVNA